jgi:hydroxymethylglutaryl-CoA lyase
VKESLLPPRGDYVSIREVGPRDGLQPERPVAVEDRVRLIDALFAAGVRHLEAAAFVSPRAVPAMADGAVVLAAIHRPSDARVAALVPNARGAADALACAVDELTVTISASETYNHRNVNRSIAESLDEVREITRLASAASVPVDAVVSCAFGSPYEGDVAPEAVARLGDRLLDAGCTRLTYADTTGVATPNRVLALVDETGPTIGLHLHQTRGTALLNAWAALQVGVRRFDTSVGGLGGSPFADGAAGNLATEELVAVLDDAGLVTGCDVEALVACAALVAELVGHPVPSTVAAAGPRNRLAHAGDTDASNPAD